MDKIQYHGNLYFISDKFINDTIMPRVPSNYFTQNGFEDSIHERVCFCKTIDKCLMALSKNCKDMVFYVYEVDNVDNYQVYQPNTEEVPDSMITEELWILTPVKVKYIGKIRCIDSVLNDGYLFHYGVESATLYEWKYEWL